LSRHSFRATADEGGTVPQVNGCQNHRSRALEVRFDVPWMSRIREFSPIFVKKKLKDRHRRSKSNIEKEKQRKNSVKRHNPISVPHQLVVLGR